VATCNRRDAVSLAIVVGTAAAGPKPGRISFIPKLGCVSRRAPITSSYRNDGFREHIRRIYTDIHAKALAEDSWHTHSSRVLGGLIATCVAESDVVLNVGAGGIDYGVRANVVNVDFVYTALCGLSGGVAGDLHSLPFADHVVDMVICVGSVLNYVSLVEAVSEMTRVCRPGGRLLLEYERSEAAIFRYEKAYKKPVARVRTAYRDATHFFWVYSDAYFDSIVRAANLTILQTGSFHVLSAIAAGVGVGADAAAKFAAADTLLPCVGRFAANRWLVAAMPSTSASDVMPPRSRRTDGR
jgi:SAM-dependent methyltransferase